MAHGGFGSVFGSTGWYWVGIRQYWLVGSTGTVVGSICWYLVVLGQYWAVLVNTLWYWVSRVCTGWYLVALGL